MGTLAFKMFSQQEMEMSEVMAFLCSCNVLLLDTEGGEEKPRRSVIVLDSYKRRL